MTPELRTEPSLTVIRPATGWIGLGLAELNEYRELLFFLVWRNVKVRYKQTVLGAAWAVLQPLLTMVVFTIFFGKLAGLASDGLPYPLFSYAALVPWTFFATGLTTSSNSLVGSQNLVTKVYFPRLVIPIAAVLSGLVDFVIAFALLVAMMVYYGIYPGWNVLWLAPMLLLAVATALGTGLWLSAMNVRFRDVRHVVPFLTQTWLFATPIAYASSEVPETWRLAYGLNPMTGVVEGFRWALLGVETRPEPMIAVSSLAAIALLTSGAYYFRRMEKSFADLV